jgi:elongation factor P
MLSLNELKVGSIIKFEEKPFEVLWAEHTKVGRGGAILRTKIRNLTDGSTIDKTFKGNDKLEQIFLEQKPYQYLYCENHEFYFMHPESFEQIALSKNYVGDKSKFLREGTEVEIVFYENNPISLILPIKMEFEITYTEPGLRGDTKSSTALKSAQIDTGAEIKVPLFIEKGEKIIIDTRSGKYVERA